MDPLDEDLDPALEPEPGESPYQRRLRRAQRMRASRRRAKGAPERQEAPRDPRDPEVAEQAREIVLRQLTASAKSRQQLEDKLADRGIPESVAQQVLDRFEEVDLVDDQAFARSYVHQRADLRKLARPALRQELLRKGVDREIVEQALEQRTDQQEQADALELVRRKLPGPQVMQRSRQDRAERERIVRRLVSMLARKGYSPGTAFQAVRSVLAEQELDLPQEHGDTSSD